MANKQFTWAKAKAMDWKNYLPPTRPSTSELAVIEKYFIELINLNPKKIFKLAILGCRVEYRSLAHKYGMDVTLIDVSELHYKILSKQFMAYTGPETFLSMDWRKMQTKEKFDIILGDLVVNMLNTEDRAFLLKNVSNMLAKDGIFISRSWITVKNNFSDFASVVKFVREKYPNVNFYAATAGSVYPAYINDTEFADVDRLKNDLEDLKKKKLISTAEYKYWHDRLKYEIKGISAISMESMDEQLSRFFEIVGMKEGIDVFADKFKIYFLKSNYESRKS